MLFHSVDARVGFRRVSLVGFAFNGQLEHSISHEFRRQLSRFGFDT